MYIYTRSTGVYVLTGKTIKQKNLSLLSLSYDFLTSGYVFGLIGHKISHYLSEADKRVAVCINFIKL